MDRNHTVRKVKVETVVHSPYFIAGMRHALHGLPFQEIAEQDNQYRYERGRQFACYARDRGLKFMEGKLPAAWVIPAYMEARRAGLIL